MISLFDLDIGNLDPLRDRKILKNCENNYRSIFWSGVEQSGLELESLEKLSMLTAIYFKRKCLTKFEINQEP